MKLVICPRCRGLGWKSIVTQGYTDQKLVYIPIQFDENGKPIPVDYSEYQTITYTCSNGHSFTDKDL